MGLLKNLIAKKKSVDKISFYVFNSNKIDEAVSGMYGSYAQKILIEAIYKVVRPLGGWNSLSGNGVICSHGDLLEYDLSNNPTGI